MKSILNFLALLTFASSSFAGTTAAVDNIFTNRTQNTIGTVTAADLSLSVLSTESGPSSLAKALQTCGEVDPSGASIYSRGDGWSNKYMNCMHGIEIAANYLITTKYDRATAMAKASSKCKGPYAGECLAGVNGFILQASQSPQLPPEISLSQLNQSGTAFCDLVYNGDSTRGGGWSTTYDNCIRGTSLAISEMLQNPHNAKKYFLKTFSQCENGDFDASIYCKTGALGVFGMYNLF